MHIAGAVYRYYESRRRIFNDAKPSRKDKVANNNRKRRNRQAQKNVGSNNCQAYSYYLITLFLLYPCCSYLPEEASMYEGRKWTSGRSSRISI